MVNSVASKLLTYQVQLTGGNEINVENNQHNINQVEGNLVNYDISNKPLTQVNDLTQSADLLCQNSVKPTPFSTVQLLNSNLFLPLNAEFDQSVINVGSYISEEKQGIVDESIAMQGVQRSPQEIEALNYFKAQYTELNSVLQELRNAPNANIATEIYHTKLDHFYTLDEFVIAELAIMLQVLAERKARSGNSCINFVFLLGFYGPERKGMFKIPAFYNPEQKKVMHDRIIEYINNGKEFVLPIIVDTNGENISRSIAENCFTFDFIHRMVIFIRYQPQTNRLNAVYVNSTSTTWDHGSITQSNDEISDSFLSNLYKDAREINPNISITYANIRTGAQTAFSGCSFFAYNAMKQLIKRYQDDVNEEYMNIILQENSQSSKAIKRNIPEAKGDDLQEIVEQNIGTPWGSTIVTKSGKSILDVISSGLIHVGDYFGKSDKILFYNISICDERLKNIQRIITWLEANPGRYEEVCRKRTDVNTLFDANV